MISFRRWSKSVLTALQPLRPSRFRSRTKPLKELERAVKKLGLRGVEIGSNVANRELGDETFWPIYKALEDLDVPCSSIPTMWQDWTG